MRVVVALPSRLQSLVSSRLQALSSEGFDIALICSDHAQGIPPIQSGDGLLIIQPNDASIARKMAAAAAHASVHYCEVAVIETPLAAQYGFMLAAGGDVADLQALATVLDTLSPSPGAWWHVGTPGSAAFLANLAAKLIKNVASPVDMSNPLPQLMHAARTQQAFGSDAAEFLALTAGDTFVSVHPERHRTLASFIMNGTESPARQIARLICICSASALPS